jgi:hypothetical protein
LVPEPCYSTWVGIGCSLVLIIVILQYLRVIFIDNLKIDKTLPRKEPHKKGKTHYLLALTSLDLLLLISIIYFFTKQATLMRRSTVLSLPLKLVFLG